MLSQQELPTLDAHTGPFTYIILLKPHGEPGGVTSAGRKLGSFSHLLKDVHLVGDRAQFSRPSLPLQDRAASPGLGDVISCYPRPQQIPP